MRRGVMALAFVAACAHATPQESDTAKPSPPTQIPAAAVNDMDEITGRLTIDPVSGGKRFQGTWVATETTRFVLSYRPVADYLPFQNKRVIVRGERWFPGPDEQHIMADHFRADEVVLAEGETAHDPVPRQLLSAPIATALSDLEKIDGLWVRFVGQMVDLRTDKYDWVSATLELPDGEVFLERMDAAMTGEGERTVVCRIVRENGKITGYGPLAGCAGDVERCGMHDEDNR